MDDNSVDFRMHSSGGPENDTSQWRDDSQPHGQQKKPGDTSHRRKRRILSCDLCRRLKCRCVFEPEHDACKRCRRMRLSCGKVEDFPSSSDKSQTPNESSIEQRLKKLEEALPSPRSPALATRTSKHVEVGVEDAHDHRSMPNGQEHPKDVDDPNAVDQAVYASPAEVIRKIASQLAGGYRQTSRPQEDLVTAGLLDESGAQNLIASFVHHRRHVLLVNDETDLGVGSGQRYISPFLYTVCCVSIAGTHLNGTAADIALHRRLYERTRRMLGELMISSRIPVEELTGMLILALWNSWPPLDGPEYIDSWLLSGHCAQQAMLSINFSEIMSRTKAGTATIADQKRIRLWANICLVNLHWAATTGRPPTIASVYIHQSSLLLNFEQATMRDGMLYAEILLYSILHRNFMSVTTLDYDEYCEELEGWQVKWEHLLDLPTSGTLKLSYAISHLILSRRVLEQLKTTPDRTSGDCSSNDGSDTGIYLMQRKVFGFAFAVVQAFLCLPGHIGEHIPQFYYICLGYATLLLSKHERRPRDISENDLHHLLQSMDKRSRESRGLANSYAVLFGLKRAMRMSATPNPMANSFEEHTFDTLDLQPNESASYVEHNQNVLRIEDLGTNSLNGQESGLELMEYFFSTGHLELDRYNFG